jgi:hypothetical protein
MKTLNFKGFLLSSLLLAATVSCVEEHYDEPSLDGECETIPVTKQVSDITSTSTTTYAKYTGDDVIEAYVTSSDESGNFYKSVSFTSVDGGVGFSMPIDAYNLYTYFEPGRKVFVKMKDLYYVTENNSTVIGALYDNDTPVATDDEVGRIAGVDFKNIIKASCVKVSEEDFVKKPANITAAKNNNLLNMLIELDGVQFTDVSNGKNYFDPTVNNLGGATNHTIVDASGNTLIVRVSEFASFAGNKVNMKNGKIRGVLTKFGSDFQFMVRNESDIKLTNDRMDFYPAIGGAAATFSGAFTENFETGYTVNQTNFPKYYNDAYVGSRYWQLKTFSTNEYIELTSFGSGGTSVTAKGYFFVPVDFTAANTFTFKEEMRFNQGVALQVYYVSAANYTPGNPINTGTFTNITSSFNITYPATGASENAFNSAGTYNIPAGLTGNGYFVFEYSGTPTLTTTVQIDDIVVN